MFCCSGCAYFKSAPLHVIAVLLLCVQLCWERDFDMPQQMACTALSAVGANIISPSSSLHGVRPEAVIKLLSSAGSCRPEVLQPLLARLQQHLNDWPGDQLIQLLQVAANAGCDSGSSFLSAAATALQGKLLLLSTGKQLLNSIKVWRQQRHVTGIMRAAVLTILKHYCKQSHVVMLSCTGS